MCNLFSADTAHSAWEDSVKTTIMLVLSDQLVLMALIALTPLLLTESPAVDCHVIPYSLYFHQALYPLSSYNLPPCEIVSSSAIPCDNVFGFLRDI